MLGCGAGIGLAVVDNYTLIHPHQQCMCFSCSTTSPAGISYLFHFSHSGRCIIVSHMVFCLFLQAALLRYNLQTIKIAHCKQFILSKVIQLCSHHHNPVLEHLHHPRRFSSAHLQSFLIPHPTPGNQ